MQTIYILPGILLVTAPIAIVIAIYRLKASKDQEIQQNRNKEDLQNSLYEAGKRLEEISVLLSNGKRYDACKSFDEVSAKIDKFKHSDFTTIDWKTYFEQVKASSKQMREYLDINCSQEVKKLFYDNQAAASKAKADEDKEQKSMMMIKIFLFLVVVGFVAALAALIISR